MYGQGKHLIAQIMIRYTTNDPIKHYHECFIFPQFML